MFSLINKGPFWVCSLFFLHAALAQQTVNNASISGMVTDPSGAVVQDAMVSALQVDTGILSETQTGRDGRFRFSYLKVGTYRLTVQAAKFSESTQAVTLSLGGAYELPFSLQLASARTNVTISEAANPLETASSDIAGIAAAAEVRQLPLNGRNFLNLTLLIPGVSPTNTASNQLFAETSAVPGQGISIDSQRNFSNSFIVDGLSDNDDAAGVTGGFYGLDVIDQMQVVTSGAQAELGRALGGYVNVVTKSGTNDLHGDFYGFLRNRALNAANPLSHTVLPLTQAQYGASLAGPVIHDRTFYFANFEQRLLNQSGLVTISPQNVSLINARLAAIGYPGAAVTTGLYPDPAHLTDFFSKVDHQFAQSDQFSIRYSLYNVDSRNSRGAGGLSAPSASANLHDTDNVIAISNIATFSPRVVNETRAQFWYSNLTAPPSDPIGPAVSISGIASFGTLSGSPTGRLNKLAEGVDNLSYQAGAHAFRLGADFIYNDDTITFPRSIRGAYSFSSLSNFLNGVYNTSGYTQTFANSVVTQTNPGIGFYAQDQWTIHPRFTLNIGLRYDLQFLKTITTDTNNISPRAGFAWTPFASRKTVVRGSYGLFYDRIPLRALANALLSANNTTDPAKLSQISVSLSPTQTGAPVFPNILSSLTLPSGVLFNFSTMQTNIQNAYSQQSSLDIEHQIGTKTTIEAGYEHVRGLHLLLSVNQNVPTCVASGKNNGCRPNSSFGNNSQYSSLGDSDYNGLHLSFVQRPTSWGNYRISYTYSKATDDMGEFFFSSPVNNYNVWQDWGRSDDDQRHRLAFNGAVHTPSGPASNVWRRLTRNFELTAMLQYYSPLPFNITTGANTIQGTTARPTINGVFISRNAGSGFDFFNLSARLSRSFALTERLHLDALAEGFNLTNSINGVTLNGVFGTGAYPAAPSPTFRQITAVGDPRGFQFGMRISF